MGRLKQPRLPPLPALGRAFVVGLLICTESSLAEIGPKLSASPSLVAFTNVPVGASGAVKTIALKNAGGGVLQISALVIGGANPQDFSITSTCPSSLTVNEVCSVAVAFRPSVQGARTASLLIKGNVPERAIGLKGIGVLPPPPILSVSPGSLTFKSTVTGLAGETKVVTAKNSGKSNLLISTVTVAGGDIGDFSSTNTCGAPVSPGASCSISVIFKPMAIGSRAARLDLASNAGPKSVALKGVALAPPPAKIQASTSLITFPAQPIGTQSKVSVLILKNVGGTGLTISTITLVGASANEFSASNDCGTTIAPNSACAVRIAFLPRSERTRTATLEIKGNISTRQISIRGTGAPPPMAASLVIDGAGLSLRAGESKVVPFTVKTSEGEKIYGRIATWETSDPTVISVEDNGVVRAASYDGFDVKLATLTAKLGALSASATVRVIPKESFSGYRVDPAARRLGSDYWENTPVPLDLVLRIFLTRQKNYGKDPQYQFQYSGWAGAVTAGDFNADGFIDVFTAGSACNGWQSRPTFLLWNSETWRFEEKNLFNDGTDYLGGPIGVAPVYLNGDEYVDLVIFGHGDECGVQLNEPVSVAISDGRGGYDLRVLELEPKELAERFGHELGDLGDVTGDGLPDLYVNANSHSYIFRGIKGAPYFTNENFSHFASDVKNFPYAQNGFGERVPNASEFAFGGKITDFNGDGSNDFIMLTTEDADVSRHSRIFMNQGAGRFVADKFVNLPFFYDSANPNERNRVAHLMDVQVLDLDGDELADIVGINQESYKKWNLVVYKRRADGQYVIDREAVTYGVNALDRPQYKTSLIHTDYDGDGVKDFSYTSSGMACVNLNRKSVFLRKDGRLIEKPLKDVDPYAKWLMTKIKPYGYELEVGTDQFCQL